MTASFSAELLKLRKRPALWIFGGLLGLALALAYAVPYIVATQQSTSAADVQILKQALLPAQVLSKVLSVVDTIGGPIALVLGALTLGSEYGWATLKTILTQGPGRVQALAGKALALATALVAFVALAFAGGAIASLIVAELEHAPVVWPAVGEIAKSIGVSLLVMAVWGALGLGLAALFRGTALALGIGLIYAFVVEPVTIAFAGQLDWLQSISKGLLLTNVESLLAPFQSSAASPSWLNLVEPAQAAIVLGAYTLVFLLVATALLRRRDVA